MKKVSTVLIIALLLVCANLPRAYAAFEWPVAEWKIDFIGTMKTPDGFSAVEVKDFRNFIDQEKKNLLNPKKGKTDKAKPDSASKQMPEVPAGTPTILTEALPKDTEAAKKRFLKSDFAMYHLSMDDGQAIHTAWFLAFRDGEAMPEAVNVFSRELTPEQTEKLTEFQKWVDENLHKAQYTDEKNKVSMKLLEVMPLQSLPLQGGKIWTAGGRVVITAEGMPFAFFARAYAMSIDHRLAVGILAGFDGERPFWDPVVRDMFLGLRENPAVK